MTIGADTSKMKIYCSLRAAALIALVLVADVALADSGKAEQAYKRALKYAYAKQYSRAIDELTHAISIDPAYLEAYSDRGNAYISEGNYKLAIDDFSKCVELAPNSSNGYRFRALAYYRMNDYDRSIDDYTRAIEVDSGNFGLYRERARVYKDAGKNSLAQADAARAEQIEHALPAGALNCRCIDRLFKTFKTADWKLVKVDRPAQNQMTVGFRTTSYPIDQKLRGIYPAGWRSVEGPASDGFIVKISLAPAHSLPMSLAKDGRYTEKSVDRPYWKERTYGFEQKDGCLVVGVEEGARTDEDLLTRVERRIACVIKELE